MVEKTTENKRGINPDPQPPSTVESAAPYSKTFGDKIFDLGVYGGLGYLANAAISLLVTRRAVQRTDTKLYELGKWSEGKFETFFKQIYKNPDQVHKVTELANNILFLGFGGWALVIPMKILEDDKLRIIKKIDKTFGTEPESEEQKLAQIARYQIGPKQGYGSLFLGRLTSYAITIAAALPFITETTSVNTNLNQFLHKKLGKHLGSLKEPLLVVDKKATNIPAFVDSLSKETVLAGTAAALHYGSSKLFAHAGHSLANPPRAPKGFVPMGAAGHANISQADATEAAETPDTLVREAFREAVQAPTASDEKTIG